MPAGSRASDMVDCAQGGLLPRLDGGSPRWCLLVGSRLRYARSGYLVAHRRWPTHYGYTSLADLGSVFFHRARGTLDRLRMARGSRDGVCCADGWTLGLAVLQIGLVAIVTCCFTTTRMFGAAIGKLPAWPPGFSFPSPASFSPCGLKSSDTFFCCVTLICLERFRQGHSRALWILPPLFLIWVNTHGTFVFGLAAIGGYFASGLVKFQLGSLVAEPWTARQRIQLLFTLLCSVAWRFSSLRTERNSPLTRS